MPHQAGRLQVDGRVLRGTEGDVRRSQFGQPQGSEERPEPFEFRARQPHRDPGAQRLGHHGVGRVDRTLAGPPPARAQRQSAQDGGRHLLGLFAGCSRQHLKGLEHHGLGLGVDRCPRVPLPRLTGHLPDDPYRVLDTGFRYSEGLPERVAALERGREGRPAAEDREATEAVTRPAPAQGRENQPAVLPERTHDTGGHQFRVLAPVGGQALGERPVDELRRRMVRGTGIPVAQSAQCLQEVGHTRLAGDAQGDQYLPTPAHRLLEVGVQKAGTVRTVDGDGAGRTLTQAAGSGRFAVLVVQPCQGLQLPQPEAVRLPAGVPRLVVRDGADLLVLGHGAPRASQHPQQCGGPSASYRPVLLRGDVTGDGRQVRAVVVVQRVGGRPVLEVLPALGRAAWDPGRQPLVRVGGAKAVLHVGVRPEPGPLLGTEQAEEGPRAQARPRAGQDLGVAGAQPGQTAGRTRGGLEAVRPVHTVQPGRQVSLRRTDPYVLPLPPGPGAAPL